MLRSTDTARIMPGTSTIYARGHISFQREYARWLGRIESRAILPIKWGMLAVCIFYWMWLRDWALPSETAFAVFFIYGAVTASEQYFFLRDRVSINQVRPIVFISYFVDLAFITGMIFLDLREPPPRLMVVAPGSDLYILYLLLILRGFALFRTPVENMIVASVISVLFFLSAIWTGQNFEPHLSEAIIIRLGLIWAVAILATFIVNLVARQQEEVLRVRERLVRSEGLASLGELAAGVAHEINNPIGIIKTYAEFLKRASDKADTHYEDYETIQSEAERCENIVRRMLDFAKPNLRSFEEFDVGDLAREVVEFVFGQKGGGSVQSELKIEPKLPPVLGDPGQLRQVVLNVCINARQILEQEQVEGGRVEVTVQQRPGPRAPVEIVIHDNGPGISPEDADSVFEPFFTKREGGTGLGLAITRRIVEAHGGSIDIWPAANGGTTCAIILPIAEEED